MTKRGIACCCAFVGSLLLSQSLYADLGTLNDQVVDLQILIHYGDIEGVKQVLRSDELREYIKGGNGKGIMETLLTSRTYYLSWFQSLRQSLGEGLRKLASSSTTPGRVLSQASNLKENYLTLLRVSRYAHSIIKIAEFLFENGIFNAHEPYDVFEVESPTSRYDQRGSMLIRAIQSDDLEMIKIVLKYFPKLINDADSDGITPLSYAMAHSSRSVDSLKKLGAVEGKLVNLVATAD